jgi:hypothetical protein
MTLETDQLLRDYLDRLSDEVRRLKTVFELWVHILDRRQDRVRELNIAPAFFSTTIESLLTNVIISTCRLYDGYRSERNLIRFLNFAEQHLSLFSTGAFQVRRVLSPGAWQLEMHQPVTLDTITVHRNEIQAQESILANLFTWRDEQYAHSDKRYFHSPSSLKQDAPLQFGQIRALIDLAGTIINRYSSAFDGSVTDFVPINVFDVDKVLDVLFRYKESTVTKKGFAQQS